jgi:NADPH-dependent 7-cyano-7-deazaguanine reductase QueF
MNEQEFQDYLRRCTVGDNNFYIMDDVHRNNSKLESLIEYKESFQIHKKIFENKYYFKKIIDDDNGELSPEIIKDVSKVLATYREKRGAIDPSWTTNAPTKPQISVQVVHSVDEEFVVVNTAEFSL